MSRARELAKVGSTRQEFSGNTRTVGFSTFAEDAHFQQDISVDGNLNVTGDLTYDETTATNQRITGISTLNQTETAHLSVTGFTTTTQVIDANGGIDAATARIEDLTNNRIVIAGSGGELEDDANLTFDGSALTVNSNLDVSSSTLTVGTGNTDVIVRGDMRVTGIMSIGQGTVTIDETTVKTGTSNLHSVGVEIAGINVLGADTPIGLGATIYNNGNALFTGTVTANTGATLASAAISDLTSGRVVLAGTSGELEDDTNLTYSSGNGLVIGGETTIGAGLTVSGDMTVTGNLTVDGTQTIINSTTLSVDDKTIEMGSVDSPTDSTANAGGIVLKGASDHTILWYNDNDHWESTEHFNLLSGKEYQIADTSVLTATTLGSGVVNSSLTSVGTLTSLNVSGNVDLGDATSDTLTVTARVDSDIVPSTNNARALGTSSLRWSNIYSNDLDLSNEGSVNDFDGTWGSYLIQEGENDLFMLNRRTGKRYKFVLQEV